MNLNLNLKDKVLNKFLSKTDSFLSLIKVNSANTPSCGAIAFSLQGIRFAIEPLSFSFLEKNHLIKDSSLNKDDLPSELILALFELYLIDIKNTLDKEYSLSMNVDGYLPKESLDVFNYSFALNVNGEKLNETVVLYALDDNALLLIEKILDLLPSKEPNKVEDNINFKIYACIDSINLTLKELQSLNEGDALVLNSFNNDGNVILKCHNLKANANIVNNDLLLKSEFSLAAKENQGADTMADTSNDLDSLPVNLDLVLDSFDLPLAEIKNLKESAVLPLNNSSLSDIKIYANGKFIGSGRVIELNGTYALQLKEIIENA